MRKGAHPSNRWYRPTFLTVESVFEFKALTFSWRRGRVEAQPSKGECQT